MNRIDDNALVDLFFSAHWTSPSAKHTECYQANQVNIWRDYLPDKLLTELRGKQTGDQVRLDFNTAEIVEPYTDEKLLSVKHSQVKRHVGNPNGMEPKIGRFYPLGIIDDLPGIYSANITPFRCVGFKNGHVKLDLNHPLAGKDISITALVGGVVDKKTERGGSSTAWLEELLSGPGMQARWHGLATDYFSEGSFERQDEDDDAVFYGHPRFVQHLDDNAIEVVKGTHGRFLKDGMSVLDLMSSWTSHLPDGIRLEALTGIGMNASELKKNSLLTDYRVLDLNKAQPLPFADASFDAAICTVSVEYLNDPIKVFSEVRRVLRPKGIFIVTVSNRWFPTKAIRIWKDLHEFERMGLILEYFRLAGGYEHLNTYSMRGLPRPRTDKYYPQQWFSDPVYAVWGYKAGYPE